MLARRSLWAGCVCVHVHGGLVHGAQASSGMFCECAALRLASNVRFPPLSVAMMPCVCTRGCVEGAARVCTGTILVYHGISSVWISHDILGYVMYVTNLL